MEGAYVNTRRVRYGSDDEYAQFVPVCSTCGRFVKSDEVVTYAKVHEEPNATCHRCGRTMMLFEGFF